MASPKTTELTKIGVFYDGNYFLHVSNYYNYVHDRKSRISISGLHDFIRNQVAHEEDRDFRLCQIVDAHYFRGRLYAKDAINKGNQLYYDRVFDDILMSEGVTTHYLPVKPIYGSSGRQEKGIDVWLALEAFELAFYKRYDVMVLITSDGDYVPLVRKLNTLGTRVMILSWDFEYTDDNGSLRMTRTSQDLLEEVSYPIAMHEIIDNRLKKNESIINNLFVPRMSEKLNSDELEVDPDWIEDENEGQSRMLALSAEYKYGSILSLKNGYGFIKYPPNNIFFHFQSLLDIDFNELMPGDKVKFKTGPNEKGEDIAIDVRPA